MNLGTLRENFLRPTESSTFGILVLFSDIVPCYPFFAVAFEAPVGLVIKNGELSHSLCQFFL